MKTMAQDNGKSNIKTKFHIPNQKS